MKELLKNTDDSHGRVRQMILRRYRLIRFVAISLRKNHIVLFFSGIVFNSIGFINNISNLIIVLKINLKSLCICMVRARKPLQLTGAKFGVVSLCTFTDVNRQSRCIDKYRRLMICKNCTTCIRNKSRGQDKNGLRSRLSSAERPYEIVSILEDLEELDQRRSTRIY
ncbi:odorant receptor 13a-like [Vespula squamosa]|uniref:Odorant receptor 13a-like n=1 Tax=Vespula squamosa TaxID=30214 RepID=A0ABD1ZU78_VESSQ